MTEEVDTGILFRETQHFRQVWLWALLLSISLLMIYSMVQQLILGKPFGNNPASDPVLVVIGIIVGLGFPIFFYFLNLTTEVRNDGLYYRFSPFHLSFRRIAPEDLVKYEARTYSPIREYGGWGIRYGRGGMAYNVTGNRGVQLELASGKRILFGSQRPQEFTEAISRALGKKPGIGSG